jgi:hypothetical protein
MMRSRAVEAAILCALLGVPLLCGSEFSSYRGFEFGSSVAAAAEHAGRKPDAAKPVHQRPALIQELSWWPGSPYQTISAKDDPVRESVLRFYNGELFQIVTTYERQSVEGMTEADMVEAISSAYGTASRPKIEVSFHSNYGEVADVIARWEDPEHFCDLVRTGDGASYALILSEKHLNALAQAAIAEAERLDELEAPQKEIDLRQELEDRHRLELEKARELNVQNFRP